MEIEWDDLRVFHVAVRVGDFSNAAAKLGMDRTTVGRRFARLERAVGRSLWEQTTSGYQPTIAGRAVLQAATAMERAMARLDRALDDGGRGLVGSVRLAGTAGIAPLLLPGIAAFLAANPGMAVELVGAREAIAAIHQRHADLGIAIARGKPRDLAGVKLGEFSQARYAPAGIATDRKIGWGHATMLANPQAWAKLNAVAAGTGALEVDTMGALRDAAAGGLGSAWLWTELGEGDPRFVRLPDQPPAAAAADLWIVHRDDVALEPVVAALRDALVAAAAPAG